MTMEWILSLALSGFGADPYEWSQPVLPAQYNPSAYSTQPASQYATQPSASQYGQPTARAGISNASTQIPTSQYNSPYISPSAQARYGDLPGQTYAAQPSLTQQYTTPQYQPVPAPQTQYASQPQYTGQHYAAQPTAQQYPTQPVAQQPTAQQYGAQTYGTPQPAANPSYGSQPYGTQPVATQPQLPPNSALVNQANQWQQSAAAYTADARNALNNASSALDNVNRYTQPYLNDAWRQLPPPPTGAQAQPAQAQPQGYGWPTAATGQQTAQPGNQQPLPGWPTLQGQQQPVANNQNNPYGQPPASYQAPTYTPQPPPLLPPQNNWPSNQQPLNSWTDPRLASNPTREPQPTPADPQTMPLTDRWGNPIAPPASQQPNVDPRTTSVVSQNQQNYDPRLYPVGAGQPPSGTLGGAQQPILQPPAQGAQPGQLTNNLPNNTQPGAQLPANQSGQFGTPQLGSNVPNGSNPPSGNNQQPLNNGQLGSGQLGTGQNVNNQVANGQNGTGQFGTPQFGTPQFGTQTPNPYDRQQAPLVDGVGSQQPLVNDPRWNNVNNQNGQKSPTSLRDEVPNLFTMVKTPGATTDAAGTGDRPWFPLMLSMLGLFASLGVNLYLGWIAFESHFRYRQLLIEGDDDDTSRRGDDRDARR